MRGYVIDNPKLKEIVINKPNIKQLLLKNIIQNK